MSPMFSKIRRRFGRFRRKTAKDAHKRIDMHTDDIIIRWQNVSRFGVGPGAQGIWSFNDGTSTILPIHVFDLTAYPENDTIGPVSQGMYSVFANNTNGDLGWTRLGSQNYDGNPWASGEFIEYGLAPSAVEEGRLRWVDLKMNLYGSYGVPIKWKISLIRVHDEAAVFGAYNTGDGSRQKMMLDALTRPMRYSNILTNTGYQKKGYTVLKQYNYVVNPLDKTDMTVVNTEGEQYLSPKFIEFKDFIKMDKDVCYNWHDATTASDLTADKPATNAMDNTPSELHTNVYPSNRIFLIVQATSSFIDTTTNPDSQSPSVALTNWVPTYDICLRRKFTVTPSNS